MKAEKGAYTKKMKIAAYDIVSSALPAAWDGLTIAHISDLHNRDFGDELAARTAAVCPDIIVVTGDAYHKENRSAAAEKFFAAAVRIAPVYYVPGNHERVLRSYAAFREFLRGIGVHVLEDTFETLERDGQSIAVLGMRDPSFFERGKTDFLTVLHSLTADIEAQGIPYTILLSHRPELFPQYAAAGVSLALCGHTHGGHVRLPLIGAFYAPNQGLFPKYADGKYTIGGSAMIVSRGLGKSSWVPRICNPPELVAERLHAAPPKEETPPTNDTAELEPGTKHDTPEREKAPENKTH